MLGCEFGYVLAMASIREASCSCGQLRVTTTGEPTRVSVCHCWACQRRTGSAFGAQARFGRERVAIDGTDRTYARTGDDGGIATFHFCGTCGATVFYELDGFPNEVAVPIGAFASHDLPVPKVTVYEARAHVWVSIEGDDITRYD